MRFHNNLISGLAGALEQIFVHGQYADKAIPQLLRSNSSWGSRDRRLLAEAGYGIVRYKRFYMALGGIPALQGSSDIRPLIAAWARHNNVAVNGDIPGSDWEEDRFTARLEAAMENRVIRESIPDWLDQVGVEDLGLQRWEKELRALNTPSPVVIRANTLVADREKVQKHLAWEHFKTEVAVGYPDALILKNRGKITNTKAYRKGLFEVQDAVSQLVAPAMAPQPGETIIDCCAGAGGKTLHLAALMENDGLIHAWDVHGYKLRELKNRVARNKVTIVQTKKIGPNTALTDFHATADRVLIDAPCSGTGVLKRKPDTKWKLTPAALEEYVTLQASILNRYAALTKPGGILAYVTCSILSRENELQVRKFLDSPIGKGYEWQDGKTIWPSDTGFDGFYIAILRKK